MCCGQKRVGLRNSPAPGTAPPAANPNQAQAQAAMAHLYYLRNVPARLRGSLVGRVPDPLGRPGRPVR